MLGRGRHPGIPHPVHVGDGELGNDIGPGVECPVPDDLAHAIVQVYARRKGDIDPAGAQLSRHQPAHAPGQAHPGSGVQVVFVPDTAGGWQPRESRPKALDPASLLVDRNNQRGSSFGMNGSYQPRELLGIHVVAGKEDDSPDERVPQQLALFRLDRSALQINHQRTECHVGRSSRRPGDRTAIDST